jgi:hypothetical protein
MKKVILASVLAVVAMSANAAAVSATYCSAAAASGSGNAATLNSATDQNFVKSAFTPKCSANTHVTGEDGGSYFRVGSGSTKGKTRYAGTSVGGAVVAAGACAATGCVVSDAATAMVSSYAPSS